MVSRSFLLPAVVLACSSLTACHKTTTVGGFELDIPGGWYSETEGADALAVGTADAEWTFVVLTFTAAEIEGDKSLPAVGREIARELAAKDDTNSDPDEALTFGEPQKWSQAGLEGIIMDGALAAEGVTIDIKMLVVIAGEQYMVAFGFRAPHATPKHDRAMQAMLDSIRLSD